MGHPITCHKYKYEQLSYAVINCVGARVLINKGAGKVHQEVSHREILQIWSVWRTMRGMNSSLCRDDHHAIGGFLGAALSPRNLALGLVFLSLDPRLSGSPRLARLVTPLN